MNKKLRILILILSLCIVYASMGWVSYTLLNQEAKTAKIERENIYHSAAYEAQQSLDQTLYNLLIEEQSRDYYLYQPSFASQRAYHHRIIPPGNTEPYEVSSLIPLHKPYVKAFFQIDPNKKITGPALPQNIAAQIENIPHLYRDFLHFFKQSPHKAANTRTHNVLYVGSFQYAVIANQLWLLRPIYATNGVYIQGALLDKIQLIQQIPESIRHTFHHITLLSQNESKEHSISLKLAGLSLYLGEINQSYDFHYVTTMEWALILIWSIILLSSGLIIWVISIAFKLEQRQGAFVSAVTHELRTPLTTFSLYTELLEEGLVPEHKKQEYYATMQRECKRLDHLIENVLAYSKLRNQSKRRNKDTVTCEELFDPIADKIRQRLTSANFQFTYALSHQARIIPIRTDAIAIEQIMDNLTSNAIKYAQNEQAQIMMTVQSTRNHIIIRFRDSGPGIPKKFRKTIFKPFERTQSATDSKKSGIGLGLSFAKDMARSLGGDLTLEQGSLHGACFVLSLPRQ